MCVKAHYRCIIRDIMAEHNIEPRPHSPDHVVPYNAEFKKVVQHTDFYVGKGNTYSNAQPHYRYYRYLGALQRLLASEGRIAHVDIGCGAGLFSWVFLDWATERGVGLDRVDLYGLDHSPAMICLAQEVRTKLKQYIPKYPDLHYFHDLDDFLRELTENHHEGADYIITFGHVLVQAHKPRDIQNFTRVIAHIRELMDARSNCALVAVDAHGRSTDLATSWDLLLNSLKCVGIRYEQQDATEMAFNYDNGAKFATLCPE